MPGSDRPSSPSSRLVLLSALALLFTASLPAQAPSAWSALTPPGVVDPNAIRASKMLAMYRVGNYLRVFSAVTGRWHAITLSIGTTPQLYGEMLVVPESDRWTAFSAYRGTADVLLVTPPAPQLVSIGSWALVRAGTSSHVFSAFTGRWHTHAIPSTWLPWMGDRYLLFTTPNTAAQFDATAIDVYTGQRHDLGIQNASLAGMVGSGSTILLTLTGPGTRYYAGFSSLRPAWVFDQGPGTAGANQHFARTSDLVVADNRAFSGVTGSFVIAPAGSLTSGGLIATAGSPPSHAAGPVHGAFTALPAGAVERSGNALRSAVQIYSVPGQAIAFDALTNQTASIAVDLGPQFTASSIQRGAVAAVLDVVTSVPALYSALTHRWHPVPAGTRNEMPWPTPDSVLLRTGTDMAAFAARSGRFVTLTGPGLLGYLQDNVFGVHGGGAVHFFDSRTERWLSAPAATGPVLGNVLDTNVMLVADVGRTIAFGARSGRLETLPLSTTWHPMQIIGDVVVVHTSTQVHAFTGLPENLSWFNFPVGQAACGLGTTYRHQLRLGAGSIALQGLGLRAAAPVTLPPFGDLWLDATAVDIRFVMAVPGEERVVSEVPVPMLPALHGSEWWQQSLVLQPSGTPYLTDREWLWIL